MSNSGHGAMEARRWKCGVTPKTPKGTLLSRDAMKLLGLPLHLARQIWTPGRKLYHRLDDCHHVHHLSYIPIPLARYMAMTLPYRGKGGALPVVPFPVIDEAEDRGQLPDKLFIMWAIERNARALRCLSGANLLRAKRLALTSKIIKDCDARIPQYHRNWNKGSRPDTDI
jgi:hypothetical protein